MRLPIGFSLAKCLRASASLITMTRGLASESRALNSRPLITGIPIAPKKPSVTMRICSSVDSSGRVSGRPSMKKERLAPWPLNGRALVAATARTSALERSRANSSSKNLSPFSNVV